MIIPTHSGREAPRAFAANVAPVASASSAARLASTARVPSAPGLALIALVAWVATVPLVTGCAPKRVLGPYPREAGSGGDSPRSGPTQVDRAWGDGNLDDALGPAQGREAERGEARAREALALVGVAYRPGGAAPAGGFDCSGFTRFVYAGQGHAIPRQTGDQARWGRPVAAAGLSPGDLVFFAPHGRRISHVGIWVGQGRFVHAPKSGLTVRAERLDDPYWSSRYAGARRP